MKDEYEWGTKADFFILPPSSTDSGGLSWRIISETSP